MLTQARLKEVLKYDRKTGVFTWRVQRGNAIPPGTVAGWVTQYGYRWVEVDGKGYMASRLAWLYVKGRWPSAMVDHKNRVRDDNRWCNLREVTRKQNMENRTVTNPTGCTGVYWEKACRRWRARIRHNGVLMCLGLHDEKEAAVQARRAAERKFFTHAPTQ